MATLTLDDLDEMRQKTARDSTTIDWVKADINAALQALEDWYDAEGRAAAGAAIETAAPGVFTNPQKKRIGKHWLHHKFKGGG